MVSFITLTSDLSIVPGFLGANTYDTALVVGEKAAEIIIAELVEGAQGDQRR
jgi:hypothetical protein